MGFLHYRRRRPSLKARRSLPKTVVAPEKRTTVPAQPGAVEVMPKKGVEIPASIASGAGKSSQAPQLSVSEAAVRSDSYPPELHAVIEAEEHRVSQKAAQITVCPTAINDIKAALSPLSTGENKEFVDSIKACLRAAIAQFVDAGSSTAPLVLPQPPTVGTHPATVVPVAVPRNITTAVAPLLTKSTWVTVTREGQQKSSAQTHARITSCVAAPAARKLEKKAATAKLQDDRLFVVMVKVKRA